MPRSAPPPRSEPMPGSTCPVGAVVGTGATHRARSRAHPVSASVTASAAAMILPVMPPLPSRYDAGNSNPRWHPARRDRSSAVQNQADLLELLQVAVAALGHRPLQAAEEVQRPVRVVAG